MSGGWRTQAVAWYHLLLRPGSLAHARADFKSLVKGHVFHLFVFLGLASCLARVEAGTHVEGLVERHVLYLCAPLAAWLGALLLARALLGLLFKTAKQVVSGSLRARGQAVEAMQRRH